MSTKRGDKWLLVQWVSGNRSIVEWKAVISPVEDSNVVGSVVVAANGQGDHEAATVICSAHNRDLLEKQISPTARAHENNDEKDEDEDFSASGSSWAPSDENVSSDDEQVSKKKIKLEPSTNDNGGRRVMKPSHRADVINNILQKHYKNNFSDVNNTTQSVNAALDKKSVTDTNKQNKDKTPNAKSDIVSIKVRDIQEMKKCFHDLFQVLKEIKTSFYPSSVPTVKNSTVTEEVIVPDIKVKDFYSLNQAEGNNGYASDRSGSEELNRSEDNVLITNKYDNSKKCKPKKNKDTKRSKPQKPMRVLNEHHNNTFRRGENWIPIGSGKTLIHQYRYNKVNWKSYTVATRTLLAAAFPRKVLATHSLTGKKSPAFRDIPPKMRLDPKIVDDIVLEITERFNVRGNLVRTIITTKCADESKTLRTKLRRETKGNVDVDTDDENYFANITC